METASALPPLEIVTPPESVAPVAPIAPAPFAPTPERPSPAAALPERDSLGRAFDPAKFRPELDRIGRWKNLRGGRKPSANSPSAGERRPHAVAASPAAQPADGAPAAAAPAQATPPAPEIPMVGPGGPPPGAPAPTAETELVGAAPGKTRVAPEEAAEVACNALYFAIGVLTGEPGEASQSGASHASLRRSVAAYIEAKKIETTAGWAVILSGLAYGVQVFQRPKTNAKAQRWWQRLWSKSDTPPEVAPPRPMAPPVAPKPSPSPTPAPAPVMETPRAMPSHAQMLAAAANG